MGMVKWPSRLTCRCGETGYLSLCLLLVTTGKRTYCYRDQARSSWKRPPLLCIPKSLDSRVMGKMDSIYVPF